MNSSKIGGYPPIFEENWPFLNGRPMMFIGQVSLNQICHLENLLPKTGVLCFFITIDDIGYRYPDKKGEFKVVHVEDVTQLVFNEQFLTISEYPISFFEYYTFPSYQENIIIEGNLTDDDLSFIEETELEMRFLVDDNYDVGHQVLGHPHAIQGAVRYCWAIKYLGLENIDILTNEQIRLIKQEEDKFILLLQLDFSDQKITIDYFGDSIAYFGIHQKDLKSKNFENVILVMQNT